MSKEDKLRYAFRKVLDTPEGRLVFFSIIDSANLLDYTDMPHDLAVCQRHAGRKEMVSLLLQQLEEAYPGIYAIMIQESNIEE